MTKLISLIVVDVVVNLERFVPFHSTMRNYGYWCDKERLYVWNKKSGQFCVILLKNYLLILFFIYIYTWLVYFSILIFYYFFSHFSLQSFSLFLYPLPIGFSLSSSTIFLRGGARGVWGGAVAPSRSAQKIPLVILLFSKYVLVILITIQLYL